MFGVSPGYAGTRFVGTWVPVVAELRSDTPIETPPLQTVHHNWKGTGFESAPSLQFRVGYALNPRLTIGFEQLNWFKDFDTYTWRFSSTTVSTTSFSSTRAAQPNASARCEVDGRLTISCSPVS